MNLSPELKSFNVRKPEDYARIYDRLKLPAGKKPMQDKDNLSEKVGLATYASLSLEKGTDTRRNHHEILDAEEALENRYNIRGDVRSSMTPTFHSVKNVGREVNNKLSEIVDLRKRIVEEVASHALTLEQKRDLHKQLLDAEVFITQKNAQISLLQQQIKSMRTSNDRAKDMLESGRENLSGDIKNTNEKISELSNVIRDAESKIKDQVEAIKKEDSTPGALISEKDFTPDKKTATNPLPQERETDDILSVEQKLLMTKKAIVNLEDFENLNPGLAKERFGIDGALYLSEQVAAQPAPVVPDTQSTPSQTVAPAAAPTPAAAHQDLEALKKKEKFLEGEKVRVGWLASEIANNYRSLPLATALGNKIKESLAKMEPEGEKNALIAQVDKALSDLTIKLAATANAAAPSTTTVPAAAVVTPTTKPAETKVVTEADLKHDKQTEKRVGIAKATLLATSLALGATGIGMATSDNPEKFDAATRTSTLVKAEQNSFIEKIGNLTIDTRSKSLVAEEGDKVTLVLATLEKKGDYYLGSLGTGKDTKYVAVPPKMILDWLSKAKNDAEAEIILSHFFERVLNENPTLKGVSVITGQIVEVDTLDDKGVSHKTKALKSYSHKRNTEGDIVPAKSVNLEVNENPVAKEIFGKKYPEYVREVASKKLSELKDIPEGNMGEELKELANMLRVYKYNDWAQRETVDNLLIEILRGSSN